MAESLSLSGEGWRVAGFLGEEWRRLGVHRPGSGFDRWIPATVPGSVHWDLLRAGEIEDPYFECNSRLVEWVHQRQWVYVREVEVPASWEGRRLRLRFEGLDHEAGVFLDGRLLATHRSMFLPLEVELSEHLRAGTRHVLAVVVKEAPPGSPQLGRTSQTQNLKARMGYGWDFAARLVNLGIWRDVALLASGPATVQDVWVRSRLDEGRATITVVSSVSGETDRVEVELRGPDSTVVDRGEGTKVDLEVASPELWWPHDLGGQPLYACHVRAVAGGGVSDERLVSFGIRSVTLMPNPWPPPGAAPADPVPLPYTLCVNGERTFARGWNWVPVDLMYGRGDLAERYRHLVALAKGSGCTLLRLWGGGLLERELLYDLCDREGLLIWQDLPLCSGGTDNVPPSDVAFLSLLQREVDGVVPVYRNHPSLAIWCGGNELTDWARRPATTREPALALLARRLADLDPERPFLPASPSGPEFECSEEAGRERPAAMHDVHGPWGSSTAADFYRPHNASAALLHSEVAVEGAVALSSLVRFAAPEHQWPPDATNTVWLHHGEWWLHRERVEELFGEVSSLDEYWPLSQFLQAERLRYAVEAARRRWPQCSGAIVWQLNEPWPNAHCTSCVDYYLRPKMAYYYVRKAFAPVAVSLRYECQMIAGSVLRAEPCLISERPFEGELEVVVSDLSGRIWHRAVGVEPLEWTLPAGCPDVVIVTGLVRTAEGAVIHANPYLFSRAPAPIFGSLLGVADVELEIRQEGSSLILTNLGERYALFPAVDIDDPRWHWRLDDNFPLIAPGESKRIAVTLVPRSQRADPDSPHGRPSSGPLRLYVSGWNVPARSLLWRVE